MSGRHGRRAAPEVLPGRSVRIDDDQLDVEARPAEIELSDLFDRFGNIFVDLGAKEPTEAQHVNTLDEVPDSAWFTNRHGAERLSLAELRRGPNIGDGPDMGTPWRIFRSKIGGVTPGFQMIDGRGDRYIIKFDPPGSPELSSAAEIIGTKLFHAIGYHTPENYIVTVDPETGLAIEPGTMMADEFDDEVPLTPELLRRLFRRFPRLPDGASAWRQASTWRGNYSGHSGTTAPGATIPTTSFRTNTAASCAGSGCSRPGRTTTIRAPRTRRTVGWRWAGSGSSATT